MKQTLISKFVSGRRLLNFSACGILILASSTAMAQLNLSKGTDYVDSILLAKQFIRALYPATTLPRPNPLFARFTSEDYYFNVDVERIRRSGTTIRLAGISAAIVESCQVVAVQVTPYFVHAPCSSFDDPDKSLLTVGMEFVRTLEGTIILDHVYTFGRLPHKFHATGEPDNPEPDLSQAKYSLENKSAFLKTLPLAQLKPFIGKTRVVSADLDDLYCYCWIVILEPSGKHKKRTRYFLEFDPYEGSLQNLRLYP